MTSTQFYHFISLSGAPGEGVKKQVKPRFSHTKHKPPQKQGSYLGPEVLWMRLLPPKSQGPLDPMFQISWFQGDVMYQVPKCGVPHWISGFQVGVRISKFRTSVPKVLKSTESHWETNVPSNRKIPNEATP